MEYRSPGTTADYAQDWSALLGVDTIATSTWVVETGLTIANEANTTTQATADITTPAQAGQVLKITNTITTAGGNKFEESWFITVQDKII